MKIKDLKELIELTTKQEVARFEFCSKKYTAFNHNEEVLAEYTIKTQKIKFMEGQINA